VVKHPVKRIVVASSMSVYGEGLYRDGAGGLAEGARRTPAALRAGRWDLRDASGAPLAPVATDETKRPDLTSVYALTKFNQEQLTLMLAAAYGIEAVALRLFNVFGPGQSLSNPYTGVLAIFAGRLLNGERPLVFEDGRQRRDFVHVADVARAFRLAMQAPEAAGEIINIGSGRSYAVADVAAMLAGAMGREALTPDILARSRAGDVRHCFADIAKARRLLRFEPRRPLEQAVSELVAHVSRQRSRDHVAEAHRELAERGLVI
jgi:dTDP-L-rhamnose 4-epimerase